MVERVSGGSNRRLPKLRCMSTSERRPSAKDLQLKVLQADEKATIDPQQRGQQSKN